MYTLNFLRTPLLLVLTSMDHESFVFWSYLTGVVAAAPIWAWITAQYFLRRRVERWLLQTVLLLTVVHALLFKSWLVAVPLCLLSLLIFGQRKRLLNLEIMFTVLAHWLTAYSCHGGGMVSFWLLTGIFLTSTLFLNLIFRYPNWNQWIKGEHISLVPSYTLSAIFMTVVQVNFITVLTV